MPETSSFVKGAAGVTTDDQTNASERRAKGEFVRGVSTARNWISSSPGATYPPAIGRYHLYVAYNCPWCHRVLIARALLGLTAAVSVDVLFPNRSSDDDARGPNLWKFCPEGQMTANGAFVKFPECTVDTVNGKSYIKDIYDMCGIHDQKSVPILFDKSSKTIVSNESADILRMFATEMKDLGTSGLNLYPDEKKGEIDEMNDWLYKTINNGSYKAGFSSNQGIYEAAFEGYFTALAKIDALLQDSRFLIGDEPTEVDVRLFPTLFRHDPIYYTRFKLNERFLYQYKNVWKWLGAMMKYAGMESVSNRSYLRHCKQGYFGRTGNNTVPVGPLHYPECYKTYGWHPDTA